MAEKKHFVTVDLRHSLLAISKALDFVGIDDLHHGLRVGYMAYKCSRALNWCDEKCQTAFFTGLIHDCGVSQTNEHLRLIKQLAPQNVEAHCQRGAEALNACEVLKQFTTSVLYHHTPWEELKNVTISDEDKDLAAIVFLADRVDFFRASYLNGLHTDFIVLEQGLIAEHIQANKSSLFNPKMADAMVELCMTDAFWFEMEAESIEQIALSFNGAKWLDQSLDINQITELAMFLAHIVDAKSPYTLKHSLKVAEVAKELAVRFELDETIQSMIYIAGLMHDIGKLKTPDSILHKQAKLTAVEYMRIKRHTTDTAFTLRNFFPNSVISSWASNHHERLDGSGYPNHLNESQIDLPSRIIAVADIFQALSQDRPYRGRMQPYEIVEIMQPLVDEKKIDGSVFATIQKDLDTFYQLSTSS